jgi:hypothetical protein
MYARLRTNYNNKRAALQTNSRNLEISIEGGTERHPDEELSEHGGTDQKQCEMCAVSARYNDRPVEYL